MTIYLFPQEAGYSSGGCGRGGERYQPAHPPVHFRRTLVPRPQRQRTGTNFSFRDLYMILKRTRHNCTVQTIPIYFYIPTIGTYSPSSRYHIYYSCSRTPFFLLVSLVFQLSVLSLVVLRQMFLFCSIVIFTYQLAFTQLLFIPLISLHRLRYAFCFEQVFFCPSLLVLKSSNYRTYRYLLPVCFCTSFFFYQYDLFAPAYFFALEYSVHFMKSVITAFLFFSQYKYIIRAGVTFSTHRFVCNFNATLFFKRYLKSLLWSRSYFFRLRLEFS